MKPVTQTLTGEQGNCFAACVASILEMPLDEVPNFCAVEHDWFGAFQRWLHERGLCALDINIEGQVGILSPMPPMWMILSGPGPRGLLHAVVWRGNGSDGWKIVHDPYPNGRGIGHIQAITLLMPLDVARVQP